MIERKAPSQLDWLGALERYASPPLSALATPETVPAVFSVGIPIRQWSNVCCGVPWGPGEHPGTVHRVLAAAVAHRHASTSGRPQSLHLLDGFQNPVTSCEGRHQEGLTNSRPQLGRGLQCALLLCCTDFDPTLNRRLLSKRVVFQHGLLSVITMLQRMHL